MSNVPKGYAIPKIDIKFIDDEREENDNESLDSNYSKFNYLPNIYLSSKRNSKDSRNTSGGIEGYGLPYNDPILLFSNLLPSLPHLSSKGKKNNKSSTVTVFNNQCKINCHPIENNTNESQTRTLKGPEIVKIEKKTKKKKAKNGGKRREKIEDGEIREITDDGNDRDLNFLSDNHYSDKINGKFNINREDTMNLNDSMENNFGNFSDVIKTDINRAKSSKTYLNKPIKVKTVCERADRIDNREFLNEREERERKMIKEQRRERIESMFKMKLNEGERKREKGRGRKKTPEIIYFAENLTIDIIKSSVECLNREIAKEKKLEKAVFVPIRIIQAHNRRVNGNVQADNMTFMIRNNEKFKKNMNVSNFQKSWNFSSRLKVEQKNFIQKLNEKRENKLMERSKSCSETDNLKLDCLNNGRKMLNKESEKKLAVDGIIGKIRYSERKCIGVKGERAVMSARKRSHSHGDSYKKADIYSKSNYQDGEEITNMIFLTDEHKGNDSVRMIEREEIDTEVELAEIFEGKKVTDENGMNSIVELKMGKKEEENGIQNCTSLSKNQPEVVNGNAESFRDENKLSISNFSKWNAKKIEEFITSNHCDKLLDEKEERVSKEKEHCHENKDGVSDDGAIKKLTNTSKVEKMDLDSRAKKLLYKFKSSTNDGEEKKDSIRKMKNEIILNDLKNMSIDDIENKLKSQEPVKKFLKKPKRKPNSVILETFDDLKHQEIFKGTKQTLEGCCTEYNIISIQYQPMHCLLRYPWLKHRWTINLDSLWARMELMRKGIELNNKKYKLKAWDDVEFNDYNRYTSKTLDERSLNTLLYSSNDYVL